MNKNFYTLKESGIAYFYCLVAMLGISLAMSFLISIVALSRGVEVSQVQNYPVIQYINMFLSSIIFLIVFIGISKKYQKNYIQASRIKTKFNYFIMLVAILLAMVVFLGGLNITGLYNHLFASFLPYKEAMDISTNNFGSFLLQVLLLAIMPAVFEELVFRGIIYNGLRQKFSAGVTIVISALLFMLIHLSIYQSFYQFILGVILGLLVYYTGSIIYGMIFHFTNNFIILLLNYIFPEGSIFELVKNGDNPNAIWGSTQIIFTLVFFISAAIIVFFIFYFVKKYTFKHKNYYNLETSPLPLNYETQENIIVTNNKVVCLKEQKGHVLWYSISVAGFVILWLLQSCGVG